MLHAVEVAGATRSSGLHGSDESVQFQSVGVVVAIEEKGGARILCRCGCPGEGMNRCRSNIVDQEHPFAAEHLQPLVVTVGAVP